MTVNEIVLDLVKVSMFDTDIRIPDDADWAAVYDEMKKQTIAGLPFEFISNYSAGKVSANSEDAAKNRTECSVGDKVGSTAKSLKINDVELNNIGGAESVRKCGASRDDERLFYEWIAFGMRQTGQFDIMLKAQDEMLRLLRESGIPAAILKGCAAAIYYPRPELRAMGDIDFLVRESDYKRAEQLLSQNEYVVTHEEQKGGHHIRFVKNGIAFELHRKPNGITADDGRMTDLMEEGLSHIEMHQIRGYDIPVLPKTQNGLVLLLHIMKHIKSGLGFRQIIDWMMYVDKNLDDTYYGEYKDILETIGLKDFAVTVTGFCQIYLGLRRDITWCIGADESVCSEFLEYLSEQGNFGRKKVHVDKGAKVLASERNIFDFIRFLQRAGCINWKLAQEKPALKMFAWAYQCRKYIKIVLSQERPMDYLKYSFSEGQKKQEFYRRLGIDKVKV